MQFRACVYMTSLGLNYQPEAPQVTVVLWVICVCMCECVYGQAEFFSGVQNSSKSAYMHGLYMICSNRLSEKILKRRLHSGEKACKHFAHS